MRSPTPRRSRPPGKGPGHIACRNILKREVNLMKRENYELAVALRHALHAHPELSNRETWTKAALMDFLRDHTGLELVDKGKWFYAAYRSGADKPGIAFRADFDAVPVEDLCPVPYVSQFPGVGHKCGHDGHSAALAALALEVDQQGAPRDVFFLFQHAEETGDGARECIALFREKDVAEIYGFHNRPGVPLGTVQVLDGTIYCASRGMILAFQGTPSHACMPELGRNPAFAIAEIISRLSDLTDPGKYRGLVLATIIQVDVGEPAFGTQASRGKLLLTVRGQYEQELEELVKALKELAQREADRHGLSLTVSFCDVFPATVSRKSANDKVRQVCRELGLPLRELKEPFRSSEDFGHYTREIPGAFFEIGSGEDCGELHTVGMDFPDAIIPTAVAVYRRLIALEGPAEAAAAPEVEVTGTVSGT